MNYAKKILNELINKYENSKHRKGSAKVMRRVKYDFTASSIPEYFSDGLQNQSEVINAEMKDLESKGFFTLSWTYTEQIIESVELNIERVDEICKWLGRPKLNDIILERITWFESFEKEVKGTWMQLFAKDILEQLSKQDLPAVAEDPSILYLLKKAMIGLKSKGEETMPERLFSKKYLGDSKIFEKQIRSRIITLYKKYAGQDFVWDIDEHVLEELGIEKSNQELHICGNIIYLINGKNVDLALFSYGIGLNQQTIHNGKIEKVDADKLLIIENKTVYMEYIQKHKTKNEIIIYIGGFPGTFKRKLLKQVYDCSKNNVNFKSYFWGDIDLGGFNIFVHIRERAIPNLIPHNMGQDTLEKHQLYAEPMDKVYSQKLERLLGDPRFNEFHSTIEMMIKQNIRLEQEAQML